MASLESILDFSKPVDVPTLDAVVAVFNDPSNPSVSLLLRGQRVFYYRAVPVAVEGAFVRGGRAPILRSSGQWRSLVGDLCGGQAL